MHRRCCLQASSSVHYTTNCKHSLALLSIGEIIARNTLSWLKVLMKLLLLHLVGCLYYWINEARSHIHKKRHECLHVTISDYLITYLLITYYLLTYFMVQSHFWVANWFAASQEIPRISRNPKVHYRTHKRPPPVSILDQPNPVHPSLLP